MYQPHQPHIQIGALKLQQYALCVLNNLLNYISCATLIQLLPYLQHLQLGFVPNAPWEPGLSEVPSYQQCVYGAGLRSTGSVPIAQHSIAQTTHLLIVLSGFCVSGS